MTKRKNKQKWTAIVCLLALALCLLAGCGAKDGAAVTSLDQLNEAGRRIGITHPFFVIRQASENAA